MTARGHLRAAGAVGYLLLVAVLALGVFAMHTVGHPDEAHAIAPAHGSHAARSVTAQPYTAQSTAAQSTAAQLSSPLTRPAAHDPAAGHGQAAADPEPFAPADATTLCVAVFLGTWVLAALVRAATRRPARSGRPRAPDAAVPHAEAPPPPRPDLARLSVLRI
ncbi:hypothetical protein [Streptomyces sp. NPDC047928]|uniref:hypothetical protein n=1 Tax=unclassified Streptomyces TaxID=2593676 RepID=UPI00371EF1C7